MGDALRTSLIWHDEVMTDLVHERRASITIGTASGSTFVTPDLGLPPEFVIVRPGRRGYLLTLSDQMRGTICLDGVEHDVAAFVAAADEPNGFRGTPIGGNDWGVISLDAAGTHKLFFQFVPLEDEDWTLADPVIVAGVAGWALSVAAVTGLFAWSGVPLGDALFRGGSLASLAIGLAAVVRWLWKQDQWSRASLGFSVMVHAALLFATFKIYDRTQELTWGTNTWDKSYEVVRLDHDRPVAEAASTEASTEAAVAPSAGEPGAAAPVATTVVAPVANPMPTVSRRRTGPRPPRREATIVDLLGGTQIGAGLDKRLHRHEGLVGSQIDEVGDGGLGPTRGSGDHQDGDGDGRPRGRRPGHDQGLDTGGERAAVCIGSSCGGGHGRPITIEPQGSSDSEPTRSKDDIDRVVRAGQGQFRACYQRELDRSGARSGDLVVSFTIAGDGSVRSAQITGGSLSNAGVRECVRSRVVRLRFPRGPAAKVNYPFMFTAGG